MAMRHVSARLAALALAALLALAQPHTEADFDRHARRAVPRDAFPVLTDPPMATAAQGDARLDDEDRVLGVVIAGEARAYPLRVMGRHELVNDTLGGTPIAVSW